MKRVPKRGAGAAVGLLLAGCADLAPLRDAEPEVSQLGWLQLTDPSGWALVQPEEDPLRAHRPDDIVCSRHPWHAVGQGVEADTGQCNYIVIGTALIGGFEAGDTIQIDAWWSSLAASEPAQGHLALFVGGQTLWETWVAIPGDADARHFEFPAPFSALPDEDVVFHLHNHGFNTWTLAEFSALRPLEETP